MEKMVIQIWNVFKNNRISNFYFVNNFKIIVLLHCLKKKNNHEFYIETPNLMHQPTSLTNNFRKSKNVVMRSSFAR